MASSTETILLDNINYNRNIKRWSVPILGLPGVKAQRLYIQGEEVPIKKYNIDKDDILFSEEMVTDSTKAYLIVEFDKGNVLLSFWLPIIVAIIGLLGTLGQPILHEMGLLYNDTEYSIKVTHLGYSGKINQLSEEILVVQKKKSAFHLTDKTLDDYVLYIAVNPRQDTKSLSLQTYDFFSDPISLSLGNNSRTIVTDSTFTNRVRTLGRGAVRCLTFLVRKDRIINPGSPLNLALLPADSYFLLNASTISVEEDINF